MIFTLPGLVINVRKPEIGDIACISVWLASPAYLDNIGGGRGMPRSHYETKACRMLQENANDQSGNKYYIAEDRFSGKPIALATLCKIDWKNRHAEYTFIVGDDGYRTKLAAGDLNVVMYNYFFNSLNLNKIYGYVFAPNAVALRMNLFGGSLDGTLRRHRWMGSGAVDVHVLSVMAIEFADFVRLHANTLLKKHLERGLIAWPA